MVRLSLGLVRLQELQELLSTSTDLQFCAGSFARAGVRTRRGVRCVICGKLGREVCGNGGGLGCGRKREGLDGADVCVFGLWERNGV